MQGVHARGVLAGLGQARLWSIACMGPLQAQVHTLKCSHRHPIANARAQPLMSPLPLSPLLLLLPPGS